MGWQHSPPVGSVDPNIRHRCTVFDPMLATRGTHASTGAKGEWLPGSVIPSFVIPGEAAQQPSHGPARPWASRCVYPDIHEGYLS